MTKRDVALEVLEIEAEKLCNALRCRADWDRLTTCITAPVQAIESVLRVLAEIERKEAEEFRYEMDEEKRRGFGPGEMGGR